MACVVLALGAFLPSVSPCVCVPVTVGRVSVSLHMSDGLLSPGFVGVTPSSPALGFHPHPSDPLESSCPGQSATETSVCSWGLWWPLCLVSSLAGLQHPVDQTLSCSFLRRQHCGCPV